MSASPKHGSFAVFNVSEPFSHWLDMFRWIAALAVVFTHVNSRMFEKILTVPHAQRTVEQYAFAAISGFGRPAVLIFFVLSGFLVGGGTLRKYLKTGSFEPADYLIARLSRLWVVLLPSFLLTYVLNMLGAYTFHGIDSGIYPAPGLGSTFLHGPAIFFCNAAFLQTALCNQYGENGALWSLFNEFWYYMVWPLCMLALFSRYTAAYRILAILSSIVVLGVLSSWQFVGEDIAAYYIVWILGVTAAYAGRAVGGPFLSSTAFVIYLLLWRALLPTAYAEQHELLQFGTDLVTALLFANMLVSMKLSATLRKPPLQAIHKHLAGFSFSLYCIHTPIINVCCAFLMFAFGTGWHMIPTGPLPYILALLVVLISFGSAYLFSLLTEKHTFSVRNFVIRTFRVSNQRAAE